MVIDGRRERWEAFDDERHPALIDGVRTIRRWYNDRLPIGGGLIIAGGCGCGKTHIARAIVELQGYNAVFAEELLLINSIKASFKERNESEMSIYKRLDSASLLVYDDLGAYESDNNYWLQNIYRAVFNNRVAAGKPFLITTNLSLHANQGELSEFEYRLGERNYSRIMGAVGNKDYVINWFGVSDYRLNGFR